MAKLFSIISINFKTISCTPLAFDDDGNLRYINLPKGTYLDAARHGLLYEADRWEKIDEMCFEKITQACYSKPDVDALYHDSWTLVLNKRHRVALKKLPGIIAEMIKLEFLRREAQRIKLMAKIVAEMVVAEVIRRKTINLYPEEYYELSDFDEDDDPFPQKMFRRTNVDVKLHKKKHNQRFSKKQNSRVYLIAKLEKSKEHFLFHDFEEAVVDNNDDDYDDCDDYYD